MGELLRGFAASREQKFDTREDAKAREGVWFAQYSQYHVMLNLVRDPFLRSDRRAERQNGP